MQFIHSARAAFASALVLALSCSLEARADGALALGIPSNVATDGFSYGYSLNKETPDEAASNALRQCKTAEAGSAPSRKLCRVIETFTAKCVAIAMDPKAGTPGIGWSVDVDTESAEARAMSHCRATAGANREQFCKIDKSACDE